MILLTTVAAALAPGPSSIRTALPLMCDDGNFAATSSPVKQLVAGLTSLVNAVGGGGAVEEERLPRPGVVSPAELLEGVRADYVERNYLWTGDIDPNLYDYDCVFTDPTLSFQGLSTFQRNLENLQPFLKALVRDSDIQLYDIALDEAELRIRASWRMVGDINLPWRPTIDLKGRTTFTYDPSSDTGGRITDYEEAWELEAGKALLQLLQPGRGARSSSSNQGAS